MSAVNEKGHTKLKFTIASFVVHVLIVIGLVIAWIAIEETEPVIWASWFASFNTTIAIYATTKTYKDRAIINKEN